MIKKIGFWMIERKGGGIVNIEASQNGENVSMSPIDNPHGRSFMMCGLKEEECILLLPRAISDAEKQIIDEAIESLKNLEL